MCIASGLSVSITSVYISITSGTTPNKRFHSTQRLRRMAQCMSVVGQYVTLFLPSLMITPPFDMCCGMDVCSRYSRILNGIHDGIVGILLMVPASVACSLTRNCHPPDALGFSMARIALFLSIANRTTDDKQVQEMPPSTNESRWKRNETTR